MTLGLRDNHFARTIFCWFPPLRLAAVTSMEGALTFNSEHDACAAATSADLRIHPAVANRARFGNVMFSRTVIPVRRPEFRRSSGTRYMPRPIESFGDRMF